MLAKAFKIDVESCDLCGGKMYAVCLVMERDFIKRYLKSVNIDYDPPARAPPNLLQECFDFNQWNSDQYDEPAVYRC